MNWQAMKEYRIWIERGALLIVIIVFAFYWNNARGERDTLRKDKEALQLEREKFVAERESNKKTLEKQEKEILRQDAAWKAQVEQLEKLLGEKPKLIKVVEIRFVEKPVPGDPGPARECPEDKKDIVLLKGDKVTAALDELHYKTPNDNTVLTGRVQCIRTTPSELVLFTDYITTDAPKSDVVVLPTRREKRWGAGIITTYSRATGLDFGPKALFPPFEMGPIRLEAEAGVLFTTDGKLGVAGGIGGRW